MSPAYTRPKNRYYGYYISQAVLQYREDVAGSVIRVPGKTLDDTVKDELLGWLNSPKGILDLLANEGLSGDQLERLKNEFPVNWAAQRSHFRLSQVSTSDWPNHR